MVLFILFIGLNFLYLVVLLKKKRKKNFLEFFLELESELFVFKFSRGKTVSAIKNKSKINSFRFSGNFSDFDRVISDSLGKGKLDFGKNSRGKDSRRSGISERIVTFRGKFFIFLR